MSQMQEENLSKSYFATIIDTLFICWDRSEKAVTSVAEHE